MGSFERYKGEIIRTISRMIAIKAISPAAGGSGESKRADYLQSVLEGWGLGVKRFDYKDNFNVLRPNLVAKYGKTARTIWIIGHMDTVSEGDVNLWSRDPFKAYVKGDKIYGRGTEDNGQGVISSMYALKSLLGSELKYNYGLGLVADEEIGSIYGIKKLLKEGIFSRNDMFIIPDWGTKDGSKIEIAEKGIMWLRVTVHGKQTHGSTPQNGINAFRIAAKFALDVDRALHDKYTKQNKLYTPSKSTFEMTKHEKNVDSVNIIPGKEVFYFDCRVLPDYKLDDVIKSVEEVKKRYKTRIGIVPYQREDSPRPTSMNSEVVRVLKDSIVNNLGTNPKPIGIGGGTIAGPIRHAGYDAAAWGIEDHMAHQPDEYVKISNLIKTIKVFNGIFIEK